MNASRLSPTGAPHPGKITSNTDNGIEHRVKLLKNGRYRIDVKGSEPSQPGGTIDNPRVKIFAGRKQAPERIVLTTGPPVAAQERTPAWI